MTTSPLKAIREKCLDCTCNQQNEVRLCPAEDCPLHPFRFGKSPYNKKNLTEEQKQASSERIKKMLAVRDGKKDEVDEA